MLAINRLRVAARQCITAHVLGDVGHTLIVGPTGAGKSVLLALMAMQFRRYDNAQIFAFDFGGSIRAAARAMGGDWQDLGASPEEDAAEGVRLQSERNREDAIEMELDTTSDPPQPLVTITRVRGSRVVQNDRSIKGSNPLVQLTEDDVVDMLLEELRPWLT